MYLTMENNSTYSRGKSVSTMLQQNLQLTNYYILGMSPSDRKSTQPLLAPNIPAVPQRSASLSYSADDIVKATVDETSALEGYTSMEAGDSGSDTSENICEIEGESDDDMEDILSRVKSKKSSEV